MQRISQVWPEWQVDELIGQGGFGRVYRVSRTVGGHTSYAAVKIIDIPQSEDEVTELKLMGMDALSIRSHFEERARNLFAEIALLDTLKGSAHIVHVEDYHLEERGDSVGWTLLIRMELLEPLMQWIEREGLPNPRETARIGIQICEALAQCHAAGIIHRDVKPGNVFRSPFGDYKLGDFGIARKLGEAVRSTKSVAGTIPYMAPEVESGHYDASVDTYSLGIMLYRWLNAGKPPFVRADEQPTQATLERAQYRRLTGEKPPLPRGAGVDASLARIVCRAIEPKPADRWPSAAAFGESLQGWLDGKTMVDKPSSAHVPASDAPSSSGPASPYDFSSIATADARAALYEVEKAAREAEERKRRQQARSKPPKPTPSARVEAHPKPPENTGTANPALESVVTELRHVANDTSKQYLALDRAATKKEMRSALGLPAVYWTGIALMVFAVLVALVYMGPLGALGILGVCALDGYFWKLWVGPHKAYQYQTGKVEGGVLTNASLGVKVVPNPRLDMKATRDKKADDAAEGTGEGEGHSLIYVGRDARGSCCWLAYDVHDRAQTAQSQRSYAAESIQWGSQLVAPQMTQTKRIGDSFFHCSAYVFEGSRVVVNEYVTCKGSYLVVFTSVTDDSPAGSEARQMLASCLQAI